MRAAETGLGFAHPEQRLRGGLPAAAALTGSRGAVLFSALCDSNRDEGNNVELHQRRVGGESKKSSGTSGWWASNRLPRAVVTAPSCWSLTVAGTTLSNIGFAFWVVPLEPGFELDLVGVFHSRYSMVLCRSIEC